MDSHSDITITYSTDISVVESNLNRGDCLHLLCTKGQGEVTYGERSFGFGAHSMIVISKPGAMTMLTHSDDMEAVALIAPLQFLYNQLPPNHFGIGGCIDLWDNPVIPLTEDDEEKILGDFARLGERIGETSHVFYKELIGSMALTMVYDIFQAHARRDHGDSISERNADLVSRLVNMLSTGMVKEYRDVGYYAEQLHVSPKYLGNIVKKQTGRSVMHLIDQHTVPLLREYLNNPKLSLTQIADMFHFNTTSYFTRYVQKHLGKTPSEYRASLQPKKK